jgi:hypothetical protein
MRFGAFARFWLIAFLVCAAASAVVLRPDRALVTYLSLQPAPRSREALSNRAQTLDAQSSLRSSEPEAEPPDISHAQLLQQGVMRRRNDARRRLVIFAAAAFLLPTLVSLVPLAAGIRRGPAH